MKAELWFDLGHAIQYCTGTRPDRYSNKIRDEMAIID
jgi:hypothetical protein